MCVRTTLNTGNDYSENFNEKSIKIGLKNEIKNKE